MDSRLITPGRLVRLIVDEPSEGCWNMAVDEALLESAAGGITTLRFYQWQPATLSLGYFQPLDDRNQHPASHSCPVVRRSSGGGAILHDHELTYSFSCPLDDLDTQQFYQEVHLSLRAVLDYFDVNTELWEQRNGNPGQVNPFLCFLRRTPGDLVTGGVKIAGSAQRRRRGALLQHGSILLETSSHAPQLSSIQEESGVQLQFSELLDRWCQQLILRWKIEFQSSQLSAVEMERARQIEAEKYSLSVWTERR